MTCRCLPKQLIEIARTRAKRARVLIMDEPTAVLTRQESEVLYELISRLSAEGVAVVFISHKLEEIERIADSITILRDGQLVGDYPAKELSREDMVSLMVGREIGRPVPCQAPAGFPGAMRAGGQRFSKCEAPAHPAAFHCGRVKFLASRAWWAPVGLPCWSPW